MENCRVIYTVHLRWALVVGFLLLQSGCIKSDLSKCPTLAQFTVIVEATDLEGKQITEGVDEVALYLFDDQNMLVGRYDGELDKKIAFEVLEKEHYTIVAWGNSKRAGMVRPAGGIGSHRDDLYITTKTSPTRADNSYKSEHFSDLFFGQKPLFKSDANRDIEVKVPIQRRVGAITLQAKNLREYAGAGDGYTVTISDVHNKINFEGEFFGDKVIFSPNSYFDASYNFMVDKYILPATDKAITVNIHHDNRLVYTASQKSDGSPLIIDAEQTLNIFINFIDDGSGNITITAELQPWEKHIIDKE